MLFDEECDLDRGRFYQVVDVFGTNNVDSSDSDYDEPDENQDIKHQIPKK
jgi:hypothetical protein